MKNYARFFCYSVIALSVLTVGSTPVSANEIKMKSTISAVTVYNDQALVTRNSNENVPAGIHTVIISDLPWGMVDQSLKVTGTSDNEVKISDIKIDQIFLDTIPESRIAELYQRLNVLRNEKNALERNNILFKSQFDAVDAMKENFTKSLSLQNPGQKAAIDEWDRLLQFVERKKSEYSDKMESVRKEIDVKLWKIKTVEEEIRSIGSASKKAQKSVSVTLKVSKTGIVRLEISYLIYGVSWTPTYEVRAQSTDTSVQIVYSGNVRQSSNEDWNNVDLTLSTARPAMSENLPVLWRWTIDAQQVYNPVHIRGGRVAPVSPPRPNTTEVTFMGNTLSGKVIDSQTGEPLTGANVVISGTNLGGSTDVSGDFIIYNIPDGNYIVRASMIGYQTVAVTGVSISRTMGAKQTLYLSASGVQSQEVIVSAERPMVNKSMTNTARSFLVDGLSVDPEESVSSSQITSSTFSIPSKQTIPSDNRNHKINIAVDEIPVAFTYSIVPKVLQTAFLVARGKNFRDYPLLAGDANIFLDNSFVATVPLKTIMPNDSFFVNLGIDEAIRVERKLINRFVEKVGTFSTKGKVTYEFENTVENFKKQSVDIMLFDHAPVSANEKYTVEIIDPDPRAMKPDTDGIFTWIMTVQPGGKKTVKLKFAVEYPPDAPPHGLLK